MTLVQVVFVMMFLTPLTLSSHCNFPGSLKPPFVNGGDAVVGGQCVCDDWTGKTCKHDCIQLYEDDAGEECHDNCRKFVQFCNQRGYFINAYVDIDTDDNGDDKEGDHEVSPPIYTIPRHADAAGSGVQMNMIFMVSIAAIVIIAVVIGVCTGVCISSHLQSKQVAPIPAVVYDKVHDEDVLVDDFDL